MKVKLILPNAAAKHQTLSDFNYMLKLLTPKTERGDHNIMAFMPLALPTLAALTPPGFDVAITDENVENIDFDEPVDVVGISFVSYLAPKAYAIADRFREKGVYVVLGGVHVTIAPDEALEHADSIVVGEAEETWPEFLNDLKNNNPKKIYRSNKKPGLDKLVIPRWDLLKNKYYLTQLVQTTRGCVFNCDFCTVRSLFGKPRYKPVENVIREIEEIKKNSRIPKMLKIMFADDNIISNIPYAKKLFKALIPLKIRWSSQVSINVAKDEELLELAQKSGCDSFLIGFESISQDNIDSVNKGNVNSVEFYKDAIRKIHHYGMNIYSYLIFGFDNDDEKTFKQTTDFIHETALDLPLFNILTPIPGTRFYDRMMKEERVVPSSWEEFNGYKVCFKPKNLTPEKLMNGFYSSIEEVYSYEAIFNRVDKLYKDGALKLDDNFYLARTIITVLLLKELFVQKKNMRRFIRRTIKELWVKKGIRINMLLLFLDRYDFTQKLKYIRAAEADC